MGKPEKVAAPEKADSPEKLKQRETIEKLGKGAAELIKDLGYSKEKRPVMFTPMEFDRFDETDLGKTPVRTVPQTEKPEIKKFQLANKHLELAKTIVEDKPTYQQLVRFHFLDLVSDASRVQGGGPLFSDGSRQIDRDLLEAVNARKVLCQFEEGMVYDYLIGIQRYTEYLLRNFDMLWDQRDSQLKQWEEYLQNSLPLLRRTMQAYSSGLRARSIGGMLSYPRWKELGVGVTKEALDTQVTDFRQQLLLLSKDSALTGVLKINLDGGGFEVVLNVDDIQEEGSKPKEVRIKVDAGLFSDNRIKEYALLSGVIMSQVRAYVSESVPYKITDIKDNAEVSRKLRPQNLKERVHKYIAELMIQYWKTGNDIPMPDRYSMPEAKARVPHAMMSTLLQKHIGKITGEGMADVNEAGERTPKSVEELEALVNAHGQLLNEHYDYFQYLMTFQMDTTNLLAIGGKLTYLSEDAEPLTEKVRALMEAQKLSPTARRAIFFKQTQDNIEGMTMVLNTLKTTYADQYEAVGKIEQSFTEFEGKWFVQVWQLAYNLKAICLRYGYAIPQTITGLLAKTPGPEWVKKTVGFPDKLLDMLPGAEKAKKIREIESWVERITQQQKGIANIRENLDKTKNELKDKIAKTEAQLEGIKNINKMQEVLDKRGTMEADQGELMMSCAVLAWNYFKSKPEEARKLFTRDVFETHFINGASGSQLETVLIESSEKAAKKHAAILKLPSDDRLLFEQLANIGMLLELQKHGQEARSGVEDVGRSLAMTQTQLAIEQRLNQARESKHLQMGNVTWGEAATGIFVLDMTVCGGQIGKAGLNAAGWVADRAPFMIGKLHPGAIPRVIGEGYQRVSPSYWVYRGGRKAISQATGLRGAESEKSMELATGSTTNAERVTIASERYGITTKRYPNLAEAIERAHQHRLSELKDAYGRMKKAPSVAEARKIFRKEVVPILKEKIAALQAKPFNLQEADARLLVRKGVCGLEAAEMEQLASGTRPWNLAQEVEATLAEEAGAGGRVVTGGRNIPSAEVEAPQAKPSTRVAPKEVPGRSGAVASAESAEARVAGEALTAERAAKFKLNAPQLRSFGARTVNVGGKLIGAAGVALEAKAGVDSYKDMKAEVKHLETVKAQIIAELDSRTTGENPLLKAIGEGEQRKYEFVGIPGVSFSVGQIAELHNVTDAQINGWLNVGRKGAATIFFAAATLGAVSGGVVLAAIPVIIAVDAGINFTKNSIAAHKRRQILEQTPHWLLSYLGTAGVLGMTADQTFDENAGFSLTDLGPRSWAEAGFMVSSPLELSNRVLGQRDVAETKKANREKLLAIIAYNSAFRASHGDIIRDLPNLGDPRVLLDPNGAFLKEGGDFQRIVRRFAVLKLVEKKRVMLVGNHGLQGQELIDAVPISEVASLDPDTRFPRFRKGPQWNGRYMFSQEEREAALREGMMYYIQHLRELRYKERRAAIIEKTANDKDLQKQAFEALDAEVEKDKDLWFVFGKHPKDLQTSGSQETWAMKMLNESEAKADDPENPLGAGRSDAATHDAFGRASEKVRVDESGLVRPLTDAETVHLGVSPSQRVLRVGDALPDRRLYTGESFKGWLREENGDLAVFDFQHPVQGDGGQLIATVTSFTAPTQDRKRWEVSIKYKEYFDWGRDRNVTQFKGSSSRSVPFEEWVKDNPALAKSLETEFQRLELIGAGRDEQKKPTEDENGFMRSLRTIESYDVRAAKIFERARTLPRQWHRYENRPGETRVYDYVACIPKTDFEPEYFLYLKLPVVPYDPPAMSAPGAYVGAQKEPYRGAVITVMKENKAGFIYEDLGGNYRRRFSGRGQYGPWIVDGLGFPIVGDDRGSVTKVIAPYVERIDQSDAQNMIDKALNFYSKLPVSDKPTGGLLPARERFLRTLDSNLSQRARVENEPESFYYIKPATFDEAFEAAKKAVE